MSEYPLEDLFLRTFTPESTVWDCADWYAKRHGLPLVEDMACPKGHVVMVWPEMRSACAPGVYVNPSAKQITLRQNTVEYQPFDPTVKSR